MKKIVAILMVMIFFVSATAFATEKVNSLLGGAKAITSENSDLEELVYLTGTIDEIRSDMVVIGDIGYNFSENTIFLGSNNMSLTSDSFQPGTKVTIVLGADRKTVVRLIQGHITE